MWIDKKYAMLLSPRLEKYKLKKHAPFLASFRCPFCGDSQKNIRKTRGNIFENKNSLMYHCYNCGLSLSFSIFLEKLDYALYQEYLIETLKEKYGEKKEIEENDYKQEKIKFTPSLKGLKRISQLDWNHPAKQYVVDRKIPNQFHAKMYFAPRFKEWINSIIPSKFEGTNNDEPRLIIPLIDKDNNIVGCCARSFKKKSEYRYITIMFDESKDKVFGLDLLDDSKPYYITEGAIDSMFVDNCIAMVGADICDGYNGIYIFDNEPRNKEILHRIEKVIDKGHSVFIWPESIKEKDINDLVINLNYDEEKIMALLKNNIYSGLFAKLKFIEWKKR